MAKSKKKRQQDFQKVKLKVGKVLKKGENVTNASFKTRTIQVSQNLKSHDGAEPITHRKQNVNDLLTQCRHFSGSVRVDAVTGLRELITSHPEISTSHLAIILEKTSKLLIDKDSAVRKGLIKLYKVFLQNVSEKQISPFFPLLCAHLCCAMTHIFDDIQVDSLSILDLLLETYPKLIIYKSNQVLSNFVEQISRQQSQGQQKTSRSLATNPNSKTSSLKWRNSVLNRLEKFLSAILKCHSVAVGDVHSAGTVADVSDWSDGNGMRIEVFPTSFRQQWDQPGFALSVASIDQASDGGDVLAGKFPEFVKTLVPLLLECWVESAPSQQGSSGAGNLLSADSVGIMSSILTVTRSLWDCMALANVQESDTIPVGKYVKDFQHHFLGNFPYCVHTPAGRLDGRNKQNDQVSAESLNLAICDIMTNFLCQGTNQQSAHKPLANQQVENKSLWLTDVTCYLIGFMNGEFNKRLIGQNSNIIVKILHRLVVNQLDTDLLHSLLSSAYTRYTGAHCLSSEKRVYLKFFADISLHWETQAVISEELRVEFLSTLPELLPLVARENPQVAALVIDSIKTAACQKYTSLLDAISRNSTSLFNRDSGTILHLPPAVQRHLIGLLYYLPNMDSATLRMLTSLTTCDTIHEQEVAFLLQVLHDRYMSSSRQAEDAACYMGFLATLLIGFPKEEISRVRHVSTSEGHLGKYQFVYEVPPADSSSGGNVWLRHCYIVKLVCGIIDQFTNSDQIVEVIVHVLQRFLKSETSDVCVVQAETAYGICKLAESFSQCLPEGATSFVSNLCISLVQHAVMWSDLTNQNVWIPLRELTCELLMKLPGGMKLLLHTILDRMKAVGDTIYSTMAKILILFLSEGRRDTVTSDCADVMREIVAVMKSTDKMPAMGEDGQTTAMEQDQPWLVELDYLVALLK